MPVHGVALVLWLFSYYVLGLCSCVCRQGTVCMQGTRTVALADAANLAVKLCPFPSPANFSVTAASVRDYCFH